MSEKRVTSLDEIRAQAEPDVITIPGFKPGATINVAIRMVDLTPYILETGVGNPLIAVAVKKAQEGKTKEEISREVEQEATRKVLDLKTMIPAIDAVVKEALVQPTWDEITAICPLTLDQKIAIFNHATGDIGGLSSFRGK